MSKFVVLDPSLRGVGQHHFEYDVHVLRAAERQGWQPVLAAHRDLGQQRELAENWEMVSFISVAVSPKLVPAAAPRQAVCTTATLAREVATSTAIVAAVPPPARTYVTWLICVSWPGRGLRAATSAIIPPVISRIDVHS